MVLFLQQVVSAILAASMQGCKNSSAEEIQAQNYDAFTKKMKKVEEQTSKVKAIFWIWILMN